MDLNQGSLQGPVPSPDAKSELKSSLDWDEGMEGGMGLAVIVREGSEAEARRSLFSKEIVQYARSFAVCVG